tara:strand:+ start:742 stop:1119 length:378 start_codon:yes stop_codon:yes gene_type:complete
MLAPTFLAALCGGYISLEPPEAYKLWSSGAFAVTIDVRTRREYETEGHLPGALLVESLGATRLIPEALRGCEDCAIGVYCTLGVRAKQAADVLDDAGFTNVYEILGLRQLVSAGFPLDRSPLPER